MTSSLLCWWTKTKDLSLAPFVRPPAIGHCIIVICVSRDKLQTRYLLWIVGGFYVMFQKKSSSVLSGFKNTRRSRVLLDPIKHVLRVF